jgi:hypothetical protein
MFFAFGVNTTTSSSTDLTTQGMNGENSQEFHESIVTKHLNGLAMAPKAFELWFASAIGGGGGRAGTSSSTAVSGGNGGNGWRGSGGGGGGGAGVSGAVGGNGGVGGNGAVYLFWEEY